MHKVHAFPPNRSCRVALTHTLQGLKNAGDFQWCRSIRCRLTGQECRLWRAWLCDYKLGKYALLMLLAWTNNASLSFSAQICLYCAVYFMA